MALSRFWLTIISVSVIYILAMLAFGSSYSIDNIVNGKKDDPVLVRESFIDQLPTAIRDTLLKAINMQSPAKTLSFLLITI